jgi:hypothetical protein
MKARHLAGRCAASPSRECWPGPRTCRPRCGADTATARDRAVDKVITIPAQPAEQARLPSTLQHRGRRMTSRPGHPEIWFAATADALLIIAGLHLLPDAWSGARSARIWPGLVPAAAAASFTAVGLSTRVGCGCQQHQPPAFRPRLPRPRGGSAVLAVRD